MDPLTQISLGAVAAGLLAKPEHLRRALVVGGLAGGAPDLDIFIASATDPLLNLQYHRHFTHSLLLAPVIGALVGLILSGVFRKRQWPVRQTILFGVAGALTHGPLDACTSYGTSLYWPFSEYRESWDMISIIDPLFTIPMVLLLLGAFIRVNPLAIRISAVLCLTYFTLGIIQRERAESFARDLAASRGHEPGKLTVRPSLANIVLWRICYQHGDDYYVDAVRTLPFTTPRHYPGTSVPVFEPEDVIGNIPADSTLADDIRRFHHFSQGYLSRHPRQPNVLGDLRYSMLPNSITPLWGIAIDEGMPDEHIEFVNFRDPSGRAFSQLWSMIKGQEVEQLR